MKFSADIKAPLSDSAKSRYLKGLISIRFFLAALVVMSHCKDNLNHYDILTDNHLPLLSKGVFAVEYFFVLSGFLLTYIAYREYKKNDTIDIKRFFMRRILRILPLYYLAVFLGYFFLGYIYPIIFGSKYLSFSITEGITYHILILPNFIISKYTSGIGSLYSLWSIGVEEQFYLFFPFLCIVIFKRKNTILYLILTTTLYFIYYQNITLLFSSNWSETATNFAQTLKFHFMLTGGVFALLYYSYKRLFLRLFKSAFSQAAILSLFLLTISTHSILSENDLLSASIFSLFLISLACGSHLSNLLENKYLKHLGNLSYGIYVFHPLASYPTRYLLENNPYLLNLVNQSPITYFISVLLLATAAAHLSYKYYESWFLKHKKHYAV